MIDRQQMRVKAPNPNPFTLSPQHGLADTEEQAKVLVTLFQDFRQEYEEMMGEHAEVIRESMHFQDFIQKIQGKGGSEVRAIYQGIKRIRRMFQQILQKGLLLLPGLSRELTETKTKLTTLTEQMQDSNILVEGLKQKNKQTQNHLAEITMLYEKMRSDNLDLQQKITQKEQEFQSQSREIRKTFMEVSEQNQQQKKIVQQLYQSNERLSMSLNQYINDKDGLQKQLQKLSFQLSKSNSKIQMLQTQLMKKQHKLHEYQAQIQSMHDTARKKSTNSATNSITEQYDNQIRQSFNDFQDKQDKIRLNQQLYNYRAPTIKQLNGSFIMGTGIKRSNGQQQDYITEQDRRMNNINESMISQYQEISQPVREIRVSTIFDPYFSHYILISQSVKIKQDCEDMLNIDMKPYYKQIIDKRIPMHLWDQWVKNRLRQLLKSTVQAI